MEKVHVPTVAYEAALEMVGPTPPVGATKRRYMNVVDAAAPHIVAWELERLANEMREVLERTPQYTYGSQAWQLLNEIDNRVDGLRGA